MRVVGIIFIVGGLLLSLTIFLAWLGIPLMLIGALMAIFGGKRTIIIQDNRTKPPEP